MRSERCDLCVHFRRPDRCQLVMGVIAAEGWCNRWVKRANVNARRT